MERTYYTYIPICIRNVFALLILSLPEKVFTAGIGLAKNNVLLISNYKICWEKNAHSNIHIQI